MAAQQKNAYYRIYNQNTQEWDYYFFKTTAEQVITNGNYAFIKPNGGTTINGQNFTVNANNGNATASVTINASHINWYGGTKPTTNYLDDSSITNIQQALVELDTRVKAAYDNIPDGILTEDNYANTLGSVYQAKDADLTAIAGLTGTSGLLKKTAANTWALDTNAYVPTGRTINGKALSSNVTLTGADVAVSASDTTKLSVAIAALQSTAAGLTHTYALDVTAENNQSNCYNKIFNDAVTNNIINALNDYWVATITVGGSIPAGSHGASMPSVSASLAYFKTVGGANILLSDLKVGDTIFLQQVNLPDVWVTNVTSSGSALTIEFAVLESFKLVWGAINDTPTTLAGYGITDADTSINNSTGAITIKGITKTPIYDISGKAPNNHAVNANTYGLGNSTVYGHVKLVGGDLNGKTSADGMAASQAHTHSQYLTSHQSLAGYATETWVDTNFIRLTVASSAPSNPSTGDVWINV